MGRRLLAALVAIVASGVVAFAAIGDGSSSDDPAKPLGEEFGGSVAPLADCDAWNGGTRPRKLATIAAIRNQVSRDDTSVESPPLSDDEALRLFDGECKPSYAGGFRLYVLYSRAAGYAPLLRGG